MYEAPTPAEISRSQRDGTDPRIRRSTVAGLINTHYSHDPQSLASRCRAAGVDRWRVEERDWGGRLRMLFAFVKNPSRAATLATMTTAAIAIGSLSAEPGTRVTGVVPVDVGAATLEVPVAIVHGSRPGPRVAVTAGIHGAEYVSIAALREVVLGLDPSAVTGSLVAVLTASPAAFAARSIYVNPLDGLNLNRQFPGDRTDRRPSASPIG